MKRRRKGSGTIEKTRDERFRARFSFKSGEREDIDGSPFATYEEAERALDALLLELREAGAVHGGITLRKLGEKALAQRELDGYRSVDGEREVWNLRIDTWSNASLPASATTRGEVRAWLSEMRNKKTGKRLAAQTRRNALNLLRAVYAYGVDNELVDENPCDGVKVKDHGSTIDGSTFLTLKESTALVEAATDPAVALAIGTGMRSGELRALLWADIYPHHITVRYGKPGEPTKNGKTRDIPILPLALWALDRLQKTHAMVLPSVTGCHRAKGQVFDRDDWKAWLAAAKLTRRVRPHDLRHTCATLLLTGAWGRAWTYEEVKEMLGHSSVKVTERYARATGTLAQRAASAMSKPGISPTENAAIAAKAREIIERRGSDSNRRMTVLQTLMRVCNDWEAFDPALVVGLCRAYVTDASRGDAFGDARTLDLADRTWTLAEERLSRMAVA